MMADTPTKPRKAQKKLDIIYYLQRVISEQVPVFEARIADNYKRATEITKKILGCAMTYDQAFQHHFLDLESFESARAMVQTVDANTFTCRVFFKRFVIPDTFTTISGLRHCFPPGFAMFKINEKLTHEERIGIRSKWSMCIDKDEYMTPQDIFGWFHEGILKAVKRLTSDGKSDDMQYMTLIPTFPNVTIELPGDEDADNGLTIQLIPTVKGSGWPYGARLQSPMPNRQPYLGHGQRYMKRIEDEMKDGQGMWFLEAREISLPRTLETSKLFTRLLDDPQQSARLWKLSFVPAETHMLECLCQYKDSNADTVLKILQVLAQEQGGYWEVLEPAYLQMVMLWFYKKNAPNLHTISDVFRGMLNSIITTLEAVSCPHFLLPTVNVLDKLDKDKANGILEEVRLFRDRLEEDTSYILEYTGCIRKRKQVESELSSESDTSNN